MDVSNYFATNAGYTARLSQMKEVLEKYNKNKEVLPPQKKKGKYELISHINDEENSLFNNDNKYIDGENISFKNLSVYTPTRRILTQKLNITCNPKQNMIIQGP